MAAVVEMIRNIDITAEWLRIELLAQCLSASKAGNEPSEALLNQLTESQHQVDALRQENNAWHALPLAGLSELALDVLAAVYAPAANPQVALLYQTLQRNGRHQPSLALVHQLLALHTQDYATLHSTVAALVQRGLLLAGGQDALTELQPDPLWLTELTGLQHARPHIPGALRVDASTTWDDLILPAAQQAVLHEYLLWIKHARQVIEDWAGRPPGGPIALFSGSSGTGKTLAASVVANQLGWRLYRVDLGALVSKYIGETEKNLNALFDAAKHRNILLQFDEVDALMGKRGEIKDARDRYANMEVSHLLSRIEQHQGPCILTTNLRKQIDSAFRRRFHFMLSFPRPEAKQRLMLWQRLLPPNAPKSKELNLGLVAEAAPLVGGEIRNAAHHAAILAAAEAAPIGMHHIAIGVWRVLQKSDVQARPKQLRQLAAYLPTEIKLDMAQGEVT
jgi:hypothetical protein